MTAVGRLYGSLQGKIQYNRDSQGQSINSFCVLKYQFSTFLPMVYTQLTVFTLMKMFKACPDFCENTLTILHESTHFLNTIAARGVPFINGY